MKRRHQPNPPDHAVVRMRYEAYRDGLLSLEETAVYQTHLRSCADCRQWVVRQEALMTDLRADMPPPHQLAPDGAVQIQQAMYKQIKRSIVMQNVKLSLRTVAAVAAVVLIGGVALWWQFGRDSQAASPSETAVPNATSPAIAADEPVSLTFAAPPAQRSRYELMAALFNSLNPDMMVQVVTLSPGSDPATQADTAVLNQPPAAATVNSYVNLNNQLQSSTTINLQDYFEGVLQGCQAGSYAYGLPLSFTPTMLYYDKTLLAEIGVAPPAADWAWPDFVQTVTALGSGDGSRYGFGNVAGLLRLLRPLLAANLDEEGRLNAAAVEPYLRDVASLIAAGQVADVDAAVLEGLIANGRIGLWLDSPATLSPRLAELGDALGKLPVPSLGDLTATNPAETTCLVISQGSAQPEAAWRWLQYLAINPPELPPGTVLANRTVLAESDAVNLSDNSPTALAVSRAWFSSQRSQVDALLPPLQQHVVAGVPLAEALAQIDNAVANSGTTAEATVPVIASPPPDTGPTVIHFYGNQFQLVEAVNTFRQAHPDIIVDISFDARPNSSGSFTMENIAEQFDCFSWTVIGQTAPNMAEIVWDLSAMVTPELLADYPPETLALLQLGDALYGLPLEVNPVVVRYKEDRFTERGVPVPTVDWTLNDMLNTAAQLGETGDPPSYGFISSTFGELSGPDVVQLLLLEQGVQPWDTAAGTVNLTNPAVATAVAQYVTWIQQNSLYASLPGAAHDERSDLVRNGRAAMWTMRSDQRPFSIGTPEPLAMLPLPQLNSRVLSAPFQTVLFISSQAEEPTACMEWIEFLTTRTDAISAVPARQSVAASRVWQNDVGPENAAVLRQALARHLAVSRPDTQLIFFRLDLPLYGWLQEAAEAVAVGGDLTTFLADAQGKSEQYLACLSGDTAPTSEEVATCATQADPNYNSP